MTTLYKPVKITSTEQAAALPDGSMAFEDGLDAYGRPSRSAAVKHRGAWWADDRELPVIGWTALVPVEVEVEHLRTHAGAAKTLYVTDWTREDA